jgi:hypothetical protein
LCRREPAPHGGEMKFQVGRFTCELSLNDRGEVAAAWLPCQPRYLSRDERAQYRAGRAAFLERVCNVKTTAIPLALPHLQAIALAQFVKRVDFETVARFAPITVVCEDGKSEADLVWLALIELRRALAETSATTKSSAQTEGSATPRHPLPGVLNGRAQVMPGTDLTRPAVPDWDGD